MRNKKLLIAGLATIASVAGLTSCSLDNSSSSTAPRATYTNVLPISYEDTYTQTDMTAFYGQTKKSNGSSYDGALDYGFVPSVWHTLKINDVNVPVYSTRCGFQVHSFAYVDIETDGALNLNAEVKLTNLPSLAESIILPEKRKQAVTKNNKTYTFKITEYGDSTLCFGRTEIGPEYALTIYVAEKRKVEVPQGMERVDIEPGTYDDISSTPYPSLRNLANGKFYFFKKGHYYVNSIKIPNNSVVYFEPGTYLEFRQDDSNPCFSNGGTKMTILGRCLVDFSRCIGGDEKTKGPFDFVGLQDSYVEGFLSINSNSWTMCFTNCDRIEICKNMLFGYRTYSDGIMLAGCTESTVHHNFVRSGDDAIECKATSSRDVAENKLIYEYNTVWTDKANAYGAIFESNANITNVIFRHNTVGFAQSNWTDFLGCFIVYMGTEWDHVWSDIHFEDSEVYCCNNTLMNITLTSVNPYYYGDQTSSNYGGTIKKIYFDSLTLARHEKTGVDIHSLRIAAIVNPNNANAASHLKLGAIYVDNVRYLGKKLTEENLSQNKGLINVAPELNWRTTNLKFNSLSGN